MAVLEQDTVIDLLYRSCPDLKNLGIRKVFLFGSFAHNEAHLGSDVDLLVEFEPPVTFDRYMRAKFYLEDLLGCPVDLVFPETLKDRARPSIERERIDVA